MLPTSPVFTRRRALLAAAGAGSLLAGCGFALRQTPALPFRRIALAGFAERSPLAAELRSRLADSAQVVDTPGQAQVLLQALVDKRERRVVASTAAGQVRELQLRVRLEFQLTTPGGRMLIPPTELLLSRDMSYSESFALAKAQEEAELVAAMQTDIVQQLLRRLAQVNPAGPTAPAAASTPAPDAGATMQVRAEQLPQHLARGLQPVYTIHGDEPLLAQEAGDAIRTAARNAGYVERKVFTVSGQHFDWSGLLGAAQAMSLFAERQLIEIRIPTGKPGKDGSEALQRYCAALSDEVLTIVHLPKLDRQQQQGAWFGALAQAGPTIEVLPVERRQLPQWIAQRLAAQGQRVAEGDPGQQTLAFFADRVEGNLLAAHQELQKLALLYPAGELAFEQVEAAVLNVARYDVSKLCDAVLAGQTARVLRMLDGLRAEGEAAVLVHWHVADTIAGLKRVKDALAQGRPLPVAFNEGRVWGVKQRLYERVLPLLAEHQLAHLVEAASICDGIVKGLKHPAWPLDAWDALRRLVLLLVQAVASPPAPRGKAPLLRAAPRLALEA